MNLKHVLSLLLFFLLFSILAKHSFAQDTATIIFDDGNIQVKAGATIPVKVFIDSNIPVNAAQLAITYPQTNFSLLSIDSSSSLFSIKAEETAIPGVIKIARGNIQPLNGKSLLTVLNFRALQNSASVTQLGYLSKDSLVMSVTNNNILSGSQVLTVKPNVPTPTNATYELTAHGKIQTQGFITVIKQAIREFLHGLFH